MPEVIKWPDVTSGEVQLQTCMQGCSHCLADTGASLLLWGNLSLQVGQTGNK